MIAAFASQAGFAAVFHGVAAVVTVSIAAWLIVRRERYGHAGSAIVTGLVLTALWSVVVLIEGVNSSAASFAESVRNLAWLFAAYRLFASDGRHQSIRAIRPVVAALAFVELLQPAMLIVLAARPDYTESSVVVVQLTALLRLMVSDGDAPT